MITLLKTFLWKHIKKANNHLKVSNILINIMTIFYFIVNVFHLLWLFLLELLSLI